MPEPQLPAVIQAVQDQLPRLSRLLPGDVSAVAFFEHFKTAVWQNPDLLQCTRRSVVNALTRAANDGLVTDGREAVVIVRNSKRPSGGWEKVAIYQRMYGGNLARIRAALPHCRIEARLVHEKDFLEVDFGDTPAIRHRPFFGKDKGEIVAVYAIVTEASGTRHHEIMDREEIERIRDGSQNYDRAKPRGPWHDHFGEMAKKTCLNRLAKLLPQASGRPPLQADADDSGGAEDEVEVWDATTVALPEPDTNPTQPDTPVTTVTSPAPAPEPVKANGNGKAAKVGNHGTYTSGKAVEDDVVLWKTRLRELRGAIAETMAKIVVEQEWQAWDEKYAPVPEEVTAAAKQLIDKRLAAMDAQAAAYAEASGGGA